MFSKKNDSDIFSNLDSAVSSKENWEKIFFPKTPCSCSESAALQK